jgi:molecular chaperone HscC
MVERLINEPTAAAVAYGLHQREAESKFLVFDLGGGTFDVSILELFEGIMEVHASAGDAFLGGEDFVELLTDTFLKEVKLSKGSLSATTAGRLRNAIEAAKIELSKSDSAAVTLRDRDETYDWTCTRDRYAEISKPLLDRLWTPVQRAIRDAGLAARDLDAVLLVGGATRTPMVRSLVGRMLGQLPSSHLDADRVVALGASVHAAMAAKDEALEDRVLTDVAPFTLGIETSMELERKTIVDGRFAPIIERNTLIPASRSEPFTTVGHYQTEIEVPIYQGESRLVANNVYLGKMTVPVPRRRAGKVEVDVRFTYDVNGILEVEVTVPDTGIKRRTVIEGNPGVMTQEEIEARFKELAPLKLHPRDNMENRTALARAERLYEEALGELRDVIAEYTRRFESALESQDPKVVDEMRAELVGFLSDIEEGWSDL